MQELFECQTRCMAFSQSAGAGCPFLIQLHHHPQCILVKYSCHAAFTLATIDGGKFTLDPKHSKGTPLVFHAYLPQDAALRYMWHPDNADTLAKFLRDSPAETHYLFISYGREYPTLT